uniref:Ty3/gypsy retrotransposon protein n=1 Tax=Tanacetum cinerariifolium TaxID=118510 RepID=A0A6L2MN53_TANCI|nr:Ty3/gypsy retrotransposon protein [Tanacetum cinerariifolium]
MQATDGYLQPLPTPTAMWEDVSMDFITGLPVSKGMSVILVMVDRFSKYDHFGSLPISFNAHKVAELLLEISDGKTKVINQGLEQYLRAMVSDQPQQWNLLEAKNRMERLIVSGVKLCLMWEIRYSLSYSCIHKSLLLSDFQINLQSVYGPYEIVERIRKVSYRLGLPGTNRIDPVFHVSIHKLFSGNGDSAVTELPEELQEGQPLEKPMAICDLRMVLRNGSLAQQVLVKWEGRSPEEATWEWASNFKDTYPLYNLEDKIIFEARDNVMQIDINKPHNTRTNLKFSRREILLIKTKAFIIIKTQNIYLNKKRPYIYRKTRIKLNKD